MGKFTPNTFDRLKHYVSVRLQQGVPLLDADWNEMEDIRRFEVQAFLKWFVGDGVAYGNDGFKISPHIIKILGVNRIVPDDFSIQAGRCLVNGCEAINDGLFEPDVNDKWVLKNSLGMSYNEQRLVKEEKLWETWGVEPVGIFKFPDSTSTKPRLDLIYLDVWERPVDELEDKELVNKEVKMPTCTRIKCEWVVRVEQESTEDLEFFLQKLRGKSDPQHKDHGYYGLATIGWNITRADGYTIPGPIITDLRRTGVNLALLTDEIADARGMKANLGNRLDESLTKGGQLRWNVVGNEQIRDGAINKKKISLSKQPVFHNLPLIFYGEPNKLTGDFGSVSTNEYSKVWLPVMPPADAIWKKITLYINKENVKLTLRYRVLGAANMIRTVDPMCSSYKDGKFEVLFNNNSVISDATYAIILEIKPEIGEANSVTIEGLVIEYEHNVMAS